MIQNEGDQAYVCDNSYIIIQGTFHLVRTQFYMLSGPTHPVFACNTQWKCIGGLTPPPPRCVRTKWKAPNLFDNLW